MEEINYHRRRKKVKERKEVDPEAGFADGLPPGVRGIGEVAVLGVEGGIVGMAVEIEGGCGGGSGAPPGRSDGLSANDVYGRTDLDSFKTCVPIVTHKDLEPYIHASSMAKATAHPFSPTSQSPPSH